MATAEVLPVTYTAPDLVMGYWKNVCFVLWRAKPTLSSAEALQARYRAFASSCPRGFFSFGVIEAGVANPDGAVSKAITAAMDAVGSELVGTAVVLEATGFAAAALRAAIATMSLLTRSRFPRKFFGSIDEATAWTAQILPDIGGAPALSAAFADFRGRL